MLSWTFAKLINAASNFVFFVFKGKIKFCDSDEFLVFTKKQKQNSKILRNAYSFNMNIFIYIHE